MAAFGTHSHLFAPSENGFQSPPRGGGTGRGAPEEGSQPAGISTGKSVLLTAFSLAYLFYTYLIETPPPLSSFGVVLAASVSSTRPLFLIKNPLFYLSS